MVMMARGKCAGSPPFGLGAILRVACVFALIALAGCNSTETPTPTVKALATKTPKPTFTFVPTHTTVPTATTVSTVTATRTTTPIPILPTPTAKPTATPDLHISPLTGRRVGDSLILQRRVLAVRVGNDPQIRPQEGLGQADIVYEEIMEGWTLTRFTALYLDNDAERIRPIRSARLVNLAIVPQYDAALVHSGASDKIRWLISQASFVDLDQFFHSEPYSILQGRDWRGRMYTSGERVHDYLRAKGQERETLIEGYSFSPTPPPGEDALSIHIPYPKLCVVDWDYDAEIGGYLRSVQGKAHVDGLTEEQIAAENVIIFYAQHKKTDIVEDSLGSTAIDIVMAGEGRAQICRDGVLLEGRWRQNEPNALIQYYDSSGELIPLRPGKTWIQLVPADYEVTIR